MDTNTKVTNEDTGDMIEITDEKLNLQELTDAVTLPQCGAISTFMGETPGKYFNRNCIIERKTGGMVCCFHLYCIPSKSD